jgi:hypothetical protein
MFSSKVNLSKRNDAFVLGERDGILVNADGPPIIIHVAQVVFEPSAFFRSSLTVRIVG